LNGSVKPDPAHRAYISLGSNIRPEENLQKAVALLRRRAQLAALSVCYETLAVGSSGAAGSGPHFLNMAACLITPLNAAELKAQVLSPIEAQLGRVRSADKYAPRTIDLDIIVYDDRVLEPALWQQVFLALPLSELAPDLIDPDSGRTLREVAQELRGTAYAVSCPEIPFN
jgi:2-amino-4-hydroxy-6-hydroxymethyldihydropteridine diphosphokinase